MANIFHVERTDNKITLGTTGTTINIASHTASQLLGLDASKNLESVDGGSTYQPLDAGLTSLAGLTYAAAAFVKMTGANTFALRTIGETADDLQGTIDHDLIANYDANKHIDHTSVTLTAGTGLTGGGDISANRTFAVDGLLEDLDTLGANNADSEFLVGTGAGVLAWENAATAKTSIGLGNVENTQLSTWAGSTNITTLGTITTVGNITIVDGGTIGQAAGPLLTFNDTTNHLNVTGCVVRIQAGTNQNVLFKSYTGKNTFEVMNDALDTYVPINYYALEHTFKGGNVGILVDPVTALTVEGTITLKERVSAMGDAETYGQDWVKNTAPCTRWFTDDAGNDGQFMLMRSTSINSDSDAADVQGCNVLWVDTSGGDVVLGGLANGVDNQLLYVFKYGEAGILTIEHQEGTGTQKFMLNTADLTYDGIGICLPFICKGGTWYIAAYPRSFAA